jgi:chromosome partitioning protein
MGKVIALFNQKGGVGKTTTCVNLCCAFTEAGRKTLVVDCDPQGHSTSGLGIQKQNAAPNTYHVLIEGVPAEKAVVSTPYGDVIPCNRDLFGSGIQLAEAQGRETVLRQALAPLRDKYDFILIDCPALLELLTLNALCAADSVLIPVQCEYLALEGLSELMGTLRMVRRSLNPGLEVEGVVLTMYDGRTNLSLQVANAVKKHMKQAVFKTAIPRSVRVSEAPSHGMPVLCTDRSSRGAIAYRQLAEEIMKQNPRPKRQG